MKIKKNNIILISLVILLLPLTIYNIYKYHNKKHKRMIKIARNIGRSIGHFDVTDFHNLNDINVRNKVNISFTFFMKYNDCSVCKYHMNNAIDDILLKYKNSKINIVIACNNNYTDAQNYMNSYYRDYLNKVSFYFANDDDFSKLHLSFTPCLITKKDNKIEYGIVFNNGDFFKKMLKNGF